MRGSVRVGCDKHFNKAPLLGLGGDDSIRWKKNILFIFFLAYNIIFNVIIRFMSFPFLFCVFVHSFYYSITTNMSELRLKLKFGLFIKQTIRVETQTAKTVSYLLAIRLIDNFYHFK